MAKKTQPADIDPLTRQVTWTDQPFNMSNKYGNWIQGEPRTGFTEEQAAELEATPGFVVVPPTTLLNAEPEPTSPAPAAAPEAAPVSDGTPEQH